jgi:TetR/AcrR family transcriptional repressor of lmrAB and yxaGH operons
MPAGSKQRIEQIASEILSRRGYNGMGLKALSDAAGLPYGSIYHHFPGGKEQIAAAAITSIGDGVGDLLAALFATSPPDDAVRAMFDFMTERLEQSDWAEGCSVGTPAQDGAGDSAAVREACEVAFDRLVQAIADGLVAAGLTSTAAQDLATAVFAAYQGAALLARVQRSKQPLSSTGEAMAGLVRAAVS